MSRLDEALAGVRAGVDGARAALLVGLDGMVVAGSGDATDLSWDLLGAHYGEIFRRACATSSEASLEAPAELAVTSPSATVLLRSVAREYALLLVLRSPATLGKARYELRKAAEHLLPELEG